MLERDRLLEEMNRAIFWIHEYVKSCNADGVVIGNSGGKDSATVLAMAVKALGSDKVLAVEMPCLSNPNDLQDAELVAKEFGVRTVQVDLSNTYQELEGQIQTQLEQDLVDESKVNIKPRLRMTTLYAIAQTLGYLVIGTGNLCEAMVGYTTKWGDNSSDFNPIGNFTVSEVLEIGRYLGVPNQILVKAPSDGISGRTDEQKMGIRYRQIEEMIETGKTDEKARQEILNRFQLSEHKRKTVPVYQFPRDNFLINPL